MERFNEAATFAARLGFEAGFSPSQASTSCAYREIRDRFGLSAQMAVRAIGKAVECFKRDKTGCPSFKPRSAICYDNRILGFKGLDKVSLWTLAGPDGPRPGLRPVPERAVRPYKGQVDLVYQGGQFYLYCAWRCPMIGLVGTVWGMIMSFQEIATAAGAQPRPEKVAEGISTALFITLEGITLSVPAIFFFAFFRNRISQMTTEANKVADRTINSLVVAAKTSKTA